MIHNPSGDSEARLSSLQLMELARVDLGWLVWHLEPFCGRQLPGRIPGIPSDAVTITTAFRRTAWSDWRTEPCCSLEVASSFA